MPDLALPAPVGHHVGCYTRWMRPKHVGWSGSASENRTPVPLILAPDVLAWGPTAWDETPKANRF